jgi:hypothetical protein
MKYLSTALTLLLAVSSISIRASDGEDASDMGKSMLAISKMTGACGVFNLQINFQETTKMDGGSEFLMRFWTYEAARLGKTLKEYATGCAEAIKAYNKLDGMMDDINDPNGAQKK